MVDVAGIEPATPCLQIEGSVSRYLESMIYVRVIRIGFGHLGWSGASYVLFPYHTVIAKKIVPHRTSGFTSRWIKITGLRFHLCGRLVERETSNLNSSIDYPFRFRSLALPRRGPIFRRLMLASLLK